MSHLFNQNSKLKNLKYLFFLSFFPGQALPASAHGFGMRYDLPVPLWLYLTGSGAVVFFSFVIIGLFVKGSGGKHTYFRFNLLKWGVARFLVSPSALLTFKILSVALFSFVIITGLFGNQNPNKNLGPTFIWIIWWVGLAYVSALFGNIWYLLNPWRSIYVWIENLYRKFNPGKELSLGLSYPEKLGIWPGFLLFISFAWVELVFSGRSEPDNLAYIALAYSIVAWGGMYVFGREPWLRHGEPFSLVFGLLARFSPAEVRVTNSEICGSCSLDCKDHHGECVDCFECFESTGNSNREWNFRPFSVGLLRDEKVSFSMMAFVILVLSTVTFDGFTATSAWFRIRSLIFYYATPDIGVHPLTMTDTLGLVLFAALFFCVYWIFCLLMAAVARDGQSISRLARAFAFSLVPISLAYHLAHYLTFLLFQGQLIIPLISDPFGFGWDLIGTAGYKIDITIMGAKTAWFLAVFVIVVGHIIAVYLAHVIAFRIYRERRPALRSQYPMLALMVGYTMVSLWILAQPIVEGPPPGGLG